MSEIRVKSTGTIKLFESDNTSHVTIASPSSLSANRTITIPDADVTLGAGTTINNNANNRIITGSGTANTLEGESTLTYDGTNLDLADSKKIRLGTGNDYEIYHDGTHTYMDNNTGALFMRNNGSVIIEDLSGNNIIRGIDGAAVDLYHNGNAKLTTASTGVTVTGDVTASNIGNFVRVGNVESTSLVMDNFMSSSYYNYVLYCSITNTGTDNTFINMRFRNSSGGVVTANRNGSFIYTIGDGTTDYDVLSQNTASGNINRLSVGDDINEQYNYVIHITNHQGNNFFYNFTATTENWTNGCSQSIKGGGKFYSDGTNITGLDFLTNAGTSVSGKIAAFAIKTS